MVIPNTSATDAEKRCLDAFDFFFSSRRRHTRLQGDWSSDVCSSDLSIVLGFTANVDAVNGSLLLSRSYWLFYWGEQIIAGILVLLLALQIITAILPQIGRASCRERV